MNLPLFLARHIYSNHDDRRKVSRPAIRIATAGVAIGLAVMIISVCVVTGFKRTIRDKVIGFGSHFTVASDSTMIYGLNTPICIDDSVMNVLQKIEGVSHVQRYAMKQGILKTEEDFLGINMMGVGSDFDTTFISKNMVEGSLPHFNDSVSTNQILVSKKIADQLRVKTGDKIYAYFIGTEDVRARKYTISGIYSTNMKYYDDTHCLTDLRSVVKLNGWQKGQVSGASLTIADFSQLEEANMRISSVVDRHSDHDGRIMISRSILQTYPQIFSWLDLLDLNVWIILGLMVAVAGITMISGLLIIILERTNMIGTLKALGAKNKSIRHTFLWFAVFIIAKGMLIGNIVGLGICLLQQLTGLVKLDAASYYIEVVPIEINIPVILLINVATLLISVTVLVAPSYLISHIHPAKSMKYE